MKKILILIFTIAIVLGNTVSIFAQALPPTPPPAPTAPSAPTPPPAPTMPPIPTMIPTLAPTPPPVVSTPTYSPISTPTSESFITESTVSGGQDSDAGMGSSSIDTGDATTDGTLIVDVNSNLSVVLGDSGSQSGGSAGIINSGNGESSENSGSAVIINNNNTGQTNSANIVNGLYQSAITGDNSASKNTGGDSIITTGDANVTGTIITSVNTNVAGVAVSEFNVLEDTTGDIILDFGNTCITNCGSLADAVIKNTGNGTDSINTSSLDVTNNNLTDQLNDAIIVNNMDLFADSGNNDTNKNTGGDSIITTGDANVVANLLTFANNNLAGNVVYAVVNIFGNLIGDIIFPEGSFASCCGVFDTALANINNGTGSTNTTSYSNEITDSATQINNLEIENNLIFDANSGGNETKGNTGGNSSIVTGDTNIDARLINIANNNLAGGNYWLVIVNEAGKWIGKILGTSDGASFGGSDDFEFLVDENGGVTVANAGNGTDSTNTAVYNETNNNELTQVNNAKIVNNVNLEANSGGNSASKNTNGNSSIVTGDASIIANIVNFVNNNITGGGKLFVAVVNVFGSWVGDFVGPGFEQEELATSPDSIGIGGADVNSQESDDNNGGSNSNQQTTTVFQASSPQIASIVIPTVFRNSSARVLGNKISLNLPETLGSAIDVAQKKVVNINFAWLLAILFPIGIFSMIFRRRLAIKRILASFLVLMLLVSSVRPFLSLALAEEIVILGNGSGSDNTAVVSISNTTTVTQTNTASVENVVTPSVDTGNNTVNGNTGSDVSVVTGDIDTNVVLNNSLNNSIVENSCCDANDSSVLITANGKDSQNLVTMDVNNNVINITQSADIGNKVEGSANTGNNTANNTSGNVIIDTGDIKVMGGINNSPINTYFIKSAINNGGFLASISANGTDSVNKIEANLGGSNQIDAKNYYLAYNFVDWDLNTGGNIANGNTGGNVFIKTGNFFFDFLISNAGNIGYVDVGCCGIDNPNDSDDPSDPDDPDIPTVVGGSNPVSTTSSSSGSSNGSSSSAGPAILGLSATSSE